MTIDEYIAHARQKSEDKINYSIIEREEHEQLAEWLEELKIFRENKGLFEADLLREEADKTEKSFYCGYNKAIDDFVNKISLEISESIIWGMIADCFKYKNMNYTSDKIVDYVIDTANEIVEQLKAGGNDEMEK